MTLFTFGINYTGYKVSNVCIWSPSLIIFFPAGWLVSSESSPTFTCEETAIPAENPSDTFKCPPERQPLARPIRTELREPRPGPGDLGGYWLHGLVGPVWGQMLLGKATEITN